MQKTLLEDDVSLVAFASSGAVPPQNLIRTDSLVVHSCGDSLPSWAPSRRQHHFIVAGSSPSSGVHGANRPRTQFAGVRSFDRNCPASPFDENVRRAQYSCGPSLGYLWLLGPYGGGWRWASILPFLEVAFCHAQLSCGANSAACMRTKSAIDIDGEPVSFSTSWVSRS